VVAAKAEDVEGLEYLKSYFLAEVNTWQLDVSADWEKLCSLKILPNWKDLGKRLGKQMKEVAKAIADLTFAQISDFMKAGTINICGFDLSTEDLVVKREFNGDAKRFEACVSDDGSLLVAIDTTCDEELFCELRSRAVGAAMQKLRKSAGLAPSDRVEMFYEVTNAGGAEAESYELVEKALQTHKEAVLKRLKQMPLPVSHRPAHAVAVGKEILDESDICKGQFVVYLTKPQFSFDMDALLSLTGGSQAVADMLRMAVCTRDYNATEGKTSLSVNLDGTSYTLSAGQHFFFSAGAKLGV